MKKQKKAVRWLNTIWVTACGLLFLMPLLWMLSSSVKTGPEVFASDFQWIPDIIQWNNYTRVWTDSNVPFWRLYLNSLTVAVVGTVVQLVVSSMAGYSFAKIQFKGNSGSGHNYPTFYSI